MDGRSIIRAVSYGLSFLLLAGILSAAISSGVDDVRLGAYANGALVSACAIVAGLAVWASAFSGRVRGLAQRNPGAVIVPFIAREQTWNQLLSTPTAWSGYKAGVLVVDSHTVQVWRGVARFRNLATIPNGVVMDVSTDESRMGLRRTTQLVLRLRTERGWTDVQFTPVEGGFKLNVPMSAAKVVSLVDDVRSGYLAGPV